MQPLASFFKYFRAHRGFKQAPTVDNLKVA